MYSYQNQGYILGNPITYFEVDQNYRIPFSHGMALISDELYEVWNIWNAQLVKNVV